MMRSSALWSRARIAPAFCSRNENKAVARDHAVLDDLGQPAAKLAIGQRLERGGVDPDASGLVESADQVLGAGMVDPDFAPDRAIDLRQERRRHHDERKAAGEGCGNETGQIADDPAAQGDDQGVAIGGARGQLVVKPLGLRERLGGLARWNDSRLGRDAHGLECRLVGRAGIESSARCPSVTIRALRHDEPVQVAPSAWRTNGPNAGGRAGARPGCRTSAGPSSTVTRFSGGERAGIHHGRRRSKRLGTVNRSRARRLI